MAFSSVRDMVELCKETGQPLYEVILESDLTESGLTRAESEAEMHRLWSVMCATSAGYCSTDRSMSGFAGGDAAKVSEAAARGILYADGYFADVMAEALKTGIIGDPQLFALFECEHPEENIEQIVYRSLKFKKKIVEQDEREGSVRACLNFGHTIGHGIEAVRGVRGRRTTGLYHGECVALGMLPMIEDNALLKRTRAIYRTLGLPTRTGANKEKVLAYMQHDKKARGDSITIIKCPGLGCWRADKLPMTELPTLLGID